MVSGGLLKGGRGRGSVSVWVTALLCSISFLLGRNTSSTIPLLTSVDRSCFCPVVPIVPNVSRCPTVSPAPCPICNNTNNNPHPPPTPPPSQPPPPPNIDDKGVIFDNAWLADPNRVMKTINSMCKLIMDHNTGESRNIGIGVIMFCYTHVLTYKRNLDYTWDSVNSNRTDYYVGPESPPYQMDMFQYLAVLSTVASIPSRHVKGKLELEGKAFQDNGGNYKNKRRGPKKQGPNVLFWGCGTDTPLHAHVIEFLGGNITFIDNNQDYIAFCKQYHPDIRLIQPSENRTWHTKLIDQLVPKDGSGLETDDVEDPLTASEWMPQLDGIENGLPWDVIVVDGPPEFLGRSQPLYMAKRLAQSYGPNHFTHIFLHDASRWDNCIISNAIMGHDPNLSWEYSSTKGAEALESARPKQEIASNSEKKYYEWINFL